MLNRPYLPVRQRSAANRALFALVGALLGSGVAACAQRAPGRHRRRDCDLRARFQRLNGHAQAARQPHDARLADARTFGYAKSANQSGPPVVPCVAHEPYARNPGAISRTN